MFRELSACAYEDVFKGRRLVLYPVNPAAHIDALTNCLDTQIPKT